ncbi:hypothetical protein CSKR_110087 [Clonorchis sinensis]|uniref:EF-hand domain-containing protein n=1 Tax=Clonorchis sinensis TaxID=79923 RepID=A0A3R7JZC8_CLOSI|nr:hypothetical protein CSKR_110087 [Clonorchis sinensis]
MEAVDRRALHEKLHNYNETKEALEDLYKRGNLWYQANEKKYMHIMRVLQADFITRVEFTMGMKSLRAPFTDVELHLFYEMLKPSKSGLVEYARFGELVWDAWICKSTTKNKLTDLVFPENGEWIILNFRIPSLESFDTTLNFEALVTADYTGAMLRQLIFNRRENLPSHAVIMFTDPARYATTLIRCNDRLYEVGYTGGPKLSPNEGTVYYEFSVGHIDCPLLKNCNTRTAREEVLSTKVVTKSKRILTKLERLAKRDDRSLDYKMDQYLASWDDYEQFVAQVEKWYNRNSKRYMRYMSQYGQDIISEVEFKVVMRDLQVPFTDLQIHILYAWLDPKRSGMVEFSRLYEALYRALYKRYIVDDDKKNINIEYQKKWIKMTFKSPTCDPLEMPTTFDALIHLGYNGAMLVELIRQRVPNLGTRNFVLFTDPARCNETLVRCNQRLYEFEYQGGPKCAPKEGAIFYEFSNGFVDCPLLLGSRLGKPGRPKDTETSVQQDNTSPALKDQTSSN